MWTYQCIVAAVLVSLAQGKPKLTVFGAGYDMGPYDYYVSTYLRISFYQTLTIIIAFSIIR